MAYQKKKYDAEGNVVPSGTPSFIHEDKLLTNKLDIKFIWKVSDCARQHYNAVLGESLKRLDLVKKDALYMKTVKISKTKDGKVERQNNFKYLNEKYGFTMDSVEKWGNNSKNKSNFIDEHVGSHVIQKLSNVAFNAVKKVALGEAKKVRFKPKGEFITIEGKDNINFLTYSNGYLTIGKGKNTICIKVKIRTKDKSREHAMNSRLKYCRLVCKKINGKDIFFVQYVCEGYPRKKVTLGTEDTCPDIGPSTIAIVNKNKCDLLKFCAKVPNLQNEINKLKRKNSRKLRLLNPQNYDDKGAVKKGSRIWNKSKVYIKLANKIAYMEYRLACQRKAEHGKLCNYIVSISKSVKTEKLSFKAFQKMFGKSIGRSAPSMFLKRLEKKLKVYGGEYLEFPTRNTKLSQTCICGEIKKKSLSQRFHKCDKCGTVMQRDLFSAYLGLWVSKTTKKLNIKKANKNYEEYKPILEKCIEDLRILKQTNPELIISTFGI